MGDFNPTINPDIEPAIVENFNPTIVEVDEDSIKDFNPNIE